MSVTVYVRRCCASDADIGGRALTIVINIRAETALLCIETVIQPQSTADLGVWDHPLMQKDMICPDLMALTTVQELHRLSSVLPNHPDIPRAGIALDPQPP